MSVDGERRARLVAAQHQLDDVARGSQRRIAERPRRVHRREAGGGEQAVALAQRHVEAVRQAQDHLAARRRAAGLEAAEVARRHVGLERQLELAEAAARAPVADLRADGRGERSRSGHGGKIADAVIAAMTSQVMARRGASGLDAAVVLVA